jgi:acyl dehydratase
MSTVEGSLLTDEARAWVGTELVLADAVVSDDNVRRFVVGCGDVNPVYLDDAAARDAGYESAIAPPLICSALCRPVVPRGELAGDGRAEALMPPVGAGRAMAGETDVECLRPIYRGTRISGRRRLESLAEKEGRRRRFVVASWTTEYTDEHGRLLVRETYRQILS